MLLEQKVAVIYGAGGAIGGAVARAFAAQGASVFLAGRTLEKLERVAQEIRGGGDSVRTVAEHTPAVHTAQFDALDPRAVDAFVDGVVEQAGRVDISFNAIGIGDVQQPLMEISLDDFLQPITNAMRTQFLTTRAAARHMLPRGAGVILTFGGGGPQTQPGLGGFKVALDAMEGLRRQWASELGPRGIRVVTLKTGGIPESIPDSVPARLREAITESIVRDSLLKRAATLEDVGQVAAFVASDLARTITDTEVNISCGAIVE